MTTASFRRVLIYQMLSVRSGACRAQCRAVVVLLLVVLTGAARADPIEYCGLYAVYGASVAYGRPIEFEKLLEAKYIGTSNGSSATDLVRAATDFGLAASVCSGLGVEALRACDGPMILHVAGGAQLEAYNHWLLYLGCKGNDGLVVDSLSGEKWISLAQILSRWDGNAILIGDKAATASHLRWSTMSIYIQYGVVVLAGLLVVGQLPQLISHGTSDCVAPFRRRRAYFAEPAIIATVSIIAGIAFHLFDSAGFFRNPGPTSFVAAAHIESMIPKRSISDIRSQIEAETTVFVDARFAHDYQKGHLPNAFNLPIDASDEERALVLARLPKDREIVIYCQSAGCTFAKVVANGLIRDGFTQVALFPGGWLDWKSASISPLRMQAHSPDEHR